MLQFKRITVEYALKLFFSVIHSVTKYGKKQRSLNCQYKEKPLFSEARSTLQDYHDGSLSAGTSAINQKQSMFNYLLLACLPA